MLQNPPLPSPENPRSACVPSRVVHVHGGWEGKMHPHSEAATRHPQWPGAFWDHWTGFDPLESAEAMNNGLVEAEYEGNKYVVEI